MRNTQAKVQLVATTLLVSACGVPKADYDAAVWSAAVATRESRTCASERDALSARMAVIEERLAQAKSLLAERTAAVAEEQGRAVALKKQLDEATVLEGELKKQLQKLGKDADILLAERGARANALAQANTRLEELRRAQAAADARARLLRDLALKFKKMIDAAELTIGLRDGRMVIQLSNDVLFDSGQTDIKPAGKDAIERVASALVTMDRRRFQVGGNTDNVPIHNARFASNWELSTARALEVVKLLVAKGVKATTVSAGGYGEFDPVAPNDTAEGRAKNRRIEIALQPNIDELVAVP